MQKLQTTMMNASYAAALVASVATWLVLASALLMMI